MSKLKRVINRIQISFLKFDRFFLSDSKYKRKSFKVFKNAGIDFVGVPKYINYDVVFDYTKPNLIHIGEGTVITKQCVILTHDYSIECGLKSINENNLEYESMFLKDVYIGSNVFIGYRTIVLPGSRIGNNVIIGAGTVISGTIPDNSVVVGNPCRIVCSLDEWAKRKMIAKEYIKG